MSGFSGIIGFVFTFIVLMAVFISIHFVFISQIATTQDLFGDNLDKTVKTLREDYSVDNIYLSSGRLQLNIKNYGKENFYYGYGGEACFDYFIDSEFKSKKNVEFKPNFSLIGNYYFIESGDSGLIFMGYNSMIFGLETVKLISCNGNEFEFVVDSLVLDWIDNDYSFRTNLTTDVDVIDRENYIIDYTLTSSEYNNTYYDNLEYVVFCAAANFELLNLPFDNFSLTSKDYGLKNYDVVSGDVIFDDDADPTVSNGIILKGMNFDVGDKISISNFDFVNESAKTISFWFKSDSELTSIDPKKDLFKFGNEYYIGFNHQNSGKIGFYRYNSSDDITFNLKSSNSIWDADTWYNIIIVLDSSTTHKMFLNGELENSFSTTLVGDSTLGLVVGNIE
jgi:hypothetical protein